MIFLLPLLIALSPLNTSEFGLVAQKIWNNECGGSIEKLIHWNAGEEFLSLGICHFIWFPEGCTSPFEETFPALLSFYREKGIPLPPWLADVKTCPWKTRSEFLKAQNSSELLSLRKLLSNSIEYQALFQFERLQQALPKLLEASSKPDIVQKRWEELNKTAQGKFVLLDYFNFKGVGTSPTERYNEQGWGLLQVLEEISPSCSEEEVIAGFIRAAKERLTLRVKNAPPERREERWLKGWHRRVDNYLKASNKYSVSIRNALVLLTSC